MLNRLLTEDELVEFKLSEALFRLAADLLSECKTVENFHDFLKDLEEQQESIIKQTPLMMQLAEQLMNDVNEN